MMTTTRFAKISSLLSGILVLLGFALPASAGTTTLTLTKSQPGVSEQILSGEGAWLFTYHVVGKVTSLNFSIKNQSPGAADFCWVSGRVQKPKTDGSIGASSIPEAWPNACGCQWPDPDATLSVGASIQTLDANASVIVTVTYPDYAGTSPPLPCP